MKSKRAYVIPFVGLKVGTHDFEFKIEDSFFEQLEYSIIHSGNVNVELSLDKKETMLIANFSVLGTVFTSCDRCNDPIELPVKGEYQLIFKFGMEAEDDESLVVLHPDAYEIDFTAPLYELITVSLPSKIVHPKGQCNEEMLALIKQYSAAPMDSDQGSEDDDWDDEDWDDEDDDDDDDGDDDDGNDNSPIDVRWNALKNLN